MTSNARTAVSGGGHLDVLTSVRFFAAMHVVLYHFKENGLLSFLMMHDDSALAAMVNSVVTSILKTGYVSVSLFFVLSGFILAYNYEPRDLRAASRQISFWVARFARIYPVYLVGLLLWSPTASFLVLTHQRELDKTLISLVLNILVIQSWSGATAFSWNASGWSLSVEAFFYALFPYIHRIIKHWTTAALCLLALAAYVFGMSVPALYAYLAPEGAATEGWSHAYFSNMPLLCTLNIFPLFRLHEFVIGVVAGKLFFEYRPALQDIRFDLVAGLTVGTVVACLVLSPARLFPVLHNGLLAPLFALLIVALARSRWLARAGQAPVLVLLGESSYALYIIHGPLLIGFLIVWKPSSIAADAAYSTALLFLVCAGSIFIYRRVEKVYRSRLVRALTRPAADLQPAAV